MIKTTNQTKSNSTQMIAQEISVLLPVIGRKVLLEFFQTVNIPQTQMFTIMLLYEHGPSSMSQISQFMNISVPTATGIINRIEKSGFVERGIDTSDKRIVNVELTTKGRKVAKTFRKSVSEKWADILSNIEVEDQRQFLTLLQKIHLGVDQC